ncbi:acyltransferase family protein [Owenweeksia hongkongensis]|uniref:acyltransferase family protein n=1 Tax=Owenweeksia hongkongensis TaxID=253245 RepID=UPI003A8D0EEA
MSVLPNLKNRRNILKILLHIDIDLSKRIYGLDILRALAILFVIYGHGLPMLKEQFNIRSLSFLVLDGVSIFFVLSGFLIGQILIKRIITNGGGFKELRQFWIRRWFRTLPNYFLILIVVTVLGWYYWDVQIKDMFPFVLFLQNFASPHPHFFQEAWSLAVEEWFYILFPFASFAIFRSETSLKKWFPWLIITFIALSIGVRFYRYNVMEIASLKDYDHFFRKQVITRFDSLMMGVLGAYLSTFFSHGWLSKPRLKMWLGLILIIFNQLCFHYATEIFEGNYFYHTVLSFLVFATGVFLCLPILTSVKRGKGKLARGITLVSLVSYSMYLIHFTLTKGFIIPLTLRGELAEHTLGLDVLRVVIYLFVSLFGSILLYKYFEVPTTKLRDRFGKK